jgi:alpha-1,2-mannosyltransferase
MKKRINLISRIALGLIAAAMLLSGIYFARQSGSNPLVYSNDFNVYYHAASELMAGRDPYQSSLTEWTPYLYPPLLSELMIPLALLPLSVAAYIWFLISLACVASAAWMSAKLCACGQTHSPQERVELSSVERSKVERGGASEIQVCSRTSLIAAIAILIMIRFALDNFKLGQVNAMVGALSVAHVYFFVKNKKTLSAIAFALAVSIKLTPIILIAYHIAKLRMKFAALCLSLLAAATLLSFLPFGARAPETFKIFFNRTVRNEQGFDLSYAGNQSLRGAMARILESDAQADETSRQPASAPAMAISIALIIIAMFAASRASNDLAAAAPFFCCFVILSPLSWKAHFIVLIMPVAYLICRALRLSKISRACLIASLILVFALFNLTSPKVLGLAISEWADAHSLVFAGALLVLIACVWQASLGFVNLNQSD